MTQHIKPITLIILDGWGIREDRQYNPTKTIATPVLDQLFARCPHTKLKASGLAVGLPEGQIGNSEVGHIHIGAGRKVAQDLTRINAAIDHQEFAQNQVILDAISYAKNQHRAIHLLGLVSPGGVHSHISHFNAMLQLMGQHNIQNCYIHAFLDGRDTLPCSAQPSLQELTQLAHQIGTGHIVTLIGRYYAMDRDQRWERVAQAYDLLTANKASYHAANPLEGLELAYARHETDEFVKPTTIAHPQHGQKITINDGDVVMMMNFRADRVRQLSHALYDEKFHGFRREIAVKPGMFVTMTEYSKDLACPIIFPPIDLSNGLGEYLSTQHCRQLRIAETEKYAHVTYFINGGREIAFPNEDRILVPSPKVATYDLQPEMSAIPLTEKLIAAIESHQYATILCNYANPDMVGHTGIIPAAEQAVGIIDECLGRIVNSAAANNMQLLITSDHGNIELMYDENNQQPHTAHTTNLVPLIYVGDAAVTFEPNVIGALDDVAPTLLHLMGLQPPKEMTGHNLLHHRNAQ